MSQFFASDGQSIGASASASVLPMKNKDWFPVGLTGLISLQSKGLSGVFRGRQRLVEISSQASNLNSPTPVPMLPPLCRLPSGLARKGIIQGTEKSSCHLKTVSNRPANGQQIDQLCHRGNVLLEVQDQHWGGAGWHPPLRYRISWRCSNLMLNFLQPGNPWVGRGHTSTAPSSMWLQWVGIVDDDQVWTFLGEKAGGGGCFHRLFWFRVCPHLLIALYFSFCYVLHEALHLFLPAALQGRKLLIPYIYRGGMEAHSNY